MAGPAQPKEWTSPFLPLKPEQKLPHCFCFGFFLGGVISRDSGSYPRSRLRAYKTSACPAASAELIQTGICKRSRDVEREEASPSKYWLSDQGCTKLSSRHRKNACSGLVLSYCAHSGPNDSSSIQVSARLCTHVLGAHMALPTLG